MKFTFKAHGLVAWSSLWSSSEMWSVRSGAYGKRLEGHCPWIIVIFTGLQLDPETTGSYKKQGSLPACSCPVFYVMSSSFSSIIIVLDSGAVLRTALEAEQRRGSPNLGSQLQNLRGKWICASCSSVYFFHNNVKMDSRVCHRIVL